MGRKPLFRDMAQMVARFLGVEEATGSIPVISTIKDTYSNPSIRRLWVQIPCKAPLAFLAEMFYAFD